MMQVLSRWMCVSIMPGITRQPAASSSGTIRLQRRHDGGDGGAHDADIDNDKLAALQRGGVTNDHIHQFTTAGWAPR